MIESEHIASTMAYFNRCKSESIFPILVNDMFYYAEGYKMPKESIEWLQK